MPKCEKKDYPVLFIGLGGTGKDAVLAIKQKFEKHLICDELTKKPRKTAYLILDGDDNKIEGNFNRDTEYVPLSVDGVAALLGPMGTKAPEELVWFDPNIPITQAVNEAGGIRQLGRFQLFRNYKNIKSKFRNALSSIATAANANANLQIDIVICAGLTGGTGSGTFMDMGYLVRKWIKGEGYNTQKVQVFGFFTLPDLHRYGEDGAQMRESNAYAALKELDYWQNIYSKNRMDFEVEYPDGDTVNWTIDPNGNQNRPYDLPVLLSNRFTTGIGIEGDPYEQIMGKLAEAMLCCYADEVGTVFSFSSFINNIGTKLSTIMGGAKYPTNYLFSALGFGTSDATEQYIVHHETEAVLNKVLSVEMYNNGRKLDAVGTYSIADGIMHCDNERGISFMEQPEQDAVFTQRILGGPDNELDVGLVLRRIVDSEVEAFGNANKIAENDFGFDEVKNWDNKYIDGTVEEAVGNDHSGWTRLAQVYSQNQRESQWGEFEKEAKAKIAALQIGPAAFAYYLAKKFIPKVRELISYWNGKKTAKEKVFSEKRVSLRNHIDTMINVAGLNAIAIAFEAERIRRARNAVNLCNEMLEAKRDAIYAEARKNSLEGFMQELETHLYNLEIMCKELKKLHDDSKEKLENARNIQIPGVLVSVEQLREYYASVDNHDVEIAEAIDKVRAKLAQTCFELPAPPKADASAAKLAEYQRNLFTRISELIVSVHQKLQLGSMDWVVSAALSGQQNTPANQIAHVCNNVVASLEGMAEPMLPMSTNAEDAPPSYRYISVPRNAATIIQGFTAYKNQHANDIIQIKQSAIEDRLIWFKLLGGISLKDYASIDELRKSYEKTVLESGGFHLNNSFGKAIQFNDKENWRSAGQAGTLFPNIGYDELSPEKLRNRSDREKNNWKEAIRLFTEAKENGLVEDNPGNNTFTLILMKNPRRLEGANGFQTLLDGRLGGGRTDKEMLEEITRDVTGLKAQHQMSVTIGYGQFLERVVIDRLGKKPEPNVESDAVVAQYAHDEEQVKNELCAFLLSRHPNYMFNLEHYMGSMKLLLKTEKEIKERIRRNEELALARIIAAGVIEYDADNGSFVLKRNNASERLFSFTINNMNGVFSADGNLPMKEQMQRMADFMKKYKEYIFMSMLENGIADTFVYNTKMTWQEILTACKGAIDEFHNNAPDLEVKYRNSLLETYERFERLLAPNGEIDQDPALNYDDRQKVKRIYRALTETLEEDHNIVQMQRFFEEQNQNRADNQPQENGNV